MPAEFDGWTLPDSDLGCANGPCGDMDHDIDSKIEIPFGPTTTGDGFTSHLSERFDVPYEYDFQSRENFSGAPDRVDVPTGLEGYGVPAPFAGVKGQPIDLNTVGDRASDLDHGAGAPDGRGAPEASDRSVAAPGVPS